MYPIIRKRRSETFYGRKLRSCLQLIEDSGNIDKLDRSLLRRDTFNGAGYNALRLVRRRLKTTTCDDSSTALHDALKCKNVKLAKQLVKLGANVCIRDRKGRTPLHYSIQTADIPLIKLIIRKGALLRGSSSDNLGALHLAIRSKNEEVIRLLINEGVDVNNKEAGISALHWAADCVNVSAVNVLLDAGAEVNSLDKNGRSPLQYSVHASSLEHGLYIAAILIEAGADINHQNSIAGATALHEALLIINEPMVDLLLSRGANVHIRTRVGDTPLHLASDINFCGNRASIIRKLLERGSDVNACNAKQTTPLQRIVSFGDKDTVRLFMNRNPDIMKVDFEGSAALHYASCNPDEAVVNMILDKGAIVNHRSGLGITALHVACIWANPGAVRELISRGADIDAMDISGRTPILAIMTESIEDFPMKSTMEITKILKNKIAAIQILLGSGCDVNLRYFQQKRTILDIAIMLERTNHVLLNAIGVIIINCVARREAMINKAVFDDYNLALIKNYPKFRSAYELCHNELIAMKNRMIKNTSISYLQVLNEPMHVVAKYMKNKEVIKEFNTNDYLVYRNTINAKFNLAVKRLGKMEKVSTILSSILIPLADPSHVIFEKIFEYLSEADVRFLIDSYEKSCIKTNSRFENFVMELTSVLSDITSVQKL